MGKILVAERIVDRGISILRDAGHEVDIHLNLDEKELVKQIQTADALIVRSGTQVNEQLLTAAKNLSVVGRAGVGINNIDIAKATEMGIIVVNAPEANILSAAEHTLGLILAQARNIPQAHSDLKAGNWNRAEFVGVELNEKVLGIVGLGRIGQLVAHRAQAFGMKVVAYDPYLSKDRAAQVDVELLDLKELMGVADFVTLHVVSTPETKEIINAEILAAAKPGLRLINVSRGEAIDEAALYDAIQNGNVAGAAIDVFSVEPPVDRKLLELPEVVVTPHLGASTAEAQDRVSITVAEQIVLALGGQFPPFAVNISAQSIPEILRPFLPLCELLGRFFAAAHGDFSANKEKVEVLFQGEIGASDVSAGMLAILVGILKVATDQPLTYVNANAIAESRGIVLHPTTTTISKEYVNQITIKRGNQIVSGTITELEHAPRIVRIDEHKYNIAPARHLIVIRNDDRPGMIGKVGTILGETGQNIDDMHVARSPEGSALMVISTDADIGVDAKMELEKVDGINEVKLIEL